MQQVGKQTSTLFSPASALKTVLINVRKWVVSGHSSISSEARRQQGGKPGLRWQ